MEEFNLMIRELNESDAHSFMSLRILAIQDSPSAIWPTLEEEANKTLHENEMRLRHTPQQVIFGVFDGISLVGIAGLRRESLKQVAHKAILWGVFINVPYRRAGIAKKLLEKVLDYARDTDVKQVHLTVNTENVRARSFYQKLGFSTYGIEPSAMSVNGQFFDEEHMLLKL
ncbi:GNAT family N-acetyltransferase [Rouxiella badensis]|uniref:GNAT family N-acetyltransferase n=1 Tax=Rouxiella badensis TaxID=1646377 RepID=UPI001D155B1A|nr:GNAT family N-acetyltransferase [Rouxiella badensis]MCC3721663.1 GNAT family N-acetyltransferase [Rouxiella badensis]MCC3731311.1 GNAT family N-acetyltransferase [Rouxiella badensis]MCC3742943.1 GNAT family N-acetyltransferase [Rouxiella badensis]